MAPLGVAGQGAGGAGAGAPTAGGECWVCVETAGGWTRGEIIVHDPNPLPAGHLSVGDKAIVPAKDASGVPVFVKRVGVAEAPSLKLEDLRTLPVQFDAQGVRRRDFASAVACMMDGMPLGGGFQLEGPTTSLNLVKNLRDQSMTPVSSHEYWMRSADIPKGDRSTYEHEVLSCILEGVIIVDQLIFFCERLSASMARSLHLRFSLCTTSDSRPGPGGSRTAASCQPQA